VLRRRKESDFSRRKNVLLTVRKQYRYEVICKIFKPSKVPTKLSCAHISFKINMFHKQTIRAYPPPPGGARPQLGNVCFREWNVWWDLRFSQWWIWRSLFSRMLHRVVWQKFYSVAYSSLWWWRHQSHLKYRQTSTRSHGATNQNSFWNDVCRQFLCFLLLAGVCWGSYLTTQKSLIPLWIWI
jgi:hypothetical protein